MNSSERALARIIFKNLVHQKSGQAYEDLFCAIMEKAKKGFKRVKPQGNLGDRKNDGYVKSEGVYYQVYAPETPEKSVAKAAKKAASDFFGLKSYWQKIAPIKQYKFVFNDKYCGSYPEIENALATLKKRHKLKDTGTFLASDLEDALFSLGDDEILETIGFLPNPDNIHLLDYSAVAQVIAHVLENRKPLNVSQLMVAPEMDDKIDFNGLNDGVANLLRHASYHAGELEGYFAKNSKHTKRDVRDALNSAYSELSKQYSFFPPEDKSKADLVFAGLVASMAPKGGFTANTQQAAFIVLSFFFEACDVFEDPKEK